MQTENKDLDGVQSSIDQAKALSNVNDRYLTFSVGDEDFAIPLLKAKEVIALPETTPLPYSPDYFSGIMNLRGQVISVVDVRKKLGIKPKKGVAENAVVILDLEPLYIGIIVDSVNNVLQLKEDEFGPTPKMEHRKAREYLIGVAKKNDRLILLVEIQKILDVEDLLNNQMNAA